MPSLSTYHPMIYTCCACCCPGLLLANARSRIHREKAFPCCSCESCSDIQYGVKGCPTCCCVCLTASILWPLSPLMCCYLSYERWKLKTLYKHDDRLKASTWSTCCCWAVNLKEQHFFIRHLAEEGSLTFAWDFEEFRDLLPNTTSPAPPTYLSYTMYLFGPDSPSEKEFLRKLMIRVDYPLPIEVGEVELAGIQKIHTAFQPMARQPDGQIRLLEIWQIPPIRYHMLSLRPMLVEASLVVFLLDLGNRESVEEVQAAYQSHTDYLACSKVLILLKPRRPPIPSQLPSLDESEIIQVRGEGGSDGNGGEESPPLPSPAPPAASLPLTMEATLLEEQTVSWARKTTTIWFLVDLSHEEEVLRVGRELNKLLLREHSSGPPIAVVPTS